MISKTNENLQIVDRAVFQLSVFKEQEYRLISDYVKGKTVLHFECGDGSGTSILSETALKVVGIDKDPENIKNARNKYKNDNIEFFTIDAVEKKNIPLQESVFDSIVSFQTLEELSDPTTYFKEAKRVLRDGGTLILTTPNRSIRLFPFQAPWNFHHKKEYDYYAVENLTSKYFEEFQIKSLSFTGMCLRRELGRLTKIKIFLAPFSAIFIPENIRNKMLELIWNVFKGDLLFFVGNKENYKATEKEVGYIKKHIQISDLIGNRTLYFICFCTNRKKMQ
ncbi:TPA: hypothetical protein DCW38_07075 [candidate division WOR-3 bacterium]|jgi:SAM-dependent methyltransferase|uniref:Methyltransferase type 11 domain-containing protein n=1 Tax=candidate division WOR-3 bacterium TaxID=2052148 RepID=A0A350HBK6_UNCW3|nr:hypothetical protein [candidate division WOR-3 bacterium]